MSDLRTASSTTFTATISTTGTAERRQSDPAATEESSDEVLLRTIRPAPAGFAQESRYSTPTCEAGAPRDDAPAGFAQESRYSTPTCEAGAGDDDLDGDAVVSTADRLVRRIRDAAEQLVFDLVLRRGEVDPTRIADGTKRLHRLANALAERIVSKEPFDDEDLANIAIEALSIIMQATSRPTSVPSDWHEESTIAGTVEWRHDRRAFTQATGALARRLDSTR